MKLARLIFVAAYLLACTIVAPFGVAAGQSRTLVAPDEIVLYLHAQIKNTDFVEPLVCLLRRVLVGSVESQSLKLSLSNEALASPSQFDVTKVATQFSRATAGEGTSRTFKYFLMPFDMKDAQYRYLFASSFSGHVGVISLARLEVIEPRLSRRERAAATALRVYKLILKSIALVAGLPDSQRCVLAFPKSLEELDRKSAEFCAEDRATLVEGHILKSAESSGCVYVSQVQ